MRSRIFFKLLAAFLLVIAAATITLDITLSRYWQDSLSQEITRNLIQKAQLFADRVQHDKSMPLAAMVTEESQASGARATVIERSGKVLADSEANPQEMENHATRPEFVAALSGKPGTAMRRSKTVGVEFLYAAVPIPGGAVRLAYPLAIIRETIAQTHRQILWATLLAIAIAMLVAALVAQSTARRLRRIVHFAERVAAGDLSARVAEKASDEIAQVAAALDRTARKLESNFARIEESRAELEALLNGVQDGVVAVSPEHRVQWTNRSLRELLRRPVRSGAPVTDVIRDPDFLRTLEVAFSESEIQRSKVMTVLPGRTFSVTAAPMPSGSVVAVLHDLSDVERVEKTRRDFIANVSHELRTPLTSVQGYAETLLEMGAPEEMRQFLQIIQKNAARMSRLTEDLLTLARVESGESKLEPTVVSSAELIEDAVESFQEIAVARGVKIQTVANVNAEVIADRGAVHQIFSNLLDNALKYGSGGGKIEIGTNQRTDAVEFFVRDFGQGIPLQHLPRLFERFYRVDKARSAESGGTGLGLAIVKHLAMNLRSGVRVESELNHGSTFYFTLPLAQAQEESDIETSAPARI